MRKMKKRPASVEAPASTRPDLLQEWIVTARSLRDDALRPPLWAVEGLLEIDDFALLVGREGAALKSWLALDLAIARLTGTAWLGLSVRPCSPDARVLYVQGEGARRHTVRRFRRLCEGRGIDPDTLDDRLLITGPMTLVPKADRDAVRDFEVVDGAKRAVRQIDGEKARQIAELHRRAAEREVLALGDQVALLEALEETNEDGSPAHPIGLVIADTAIYCFRGEENSARDAEKFTRAASELAGALRAPVVAVHHTSRAGEGSGSRSARGSTQIEAGARAVLRVDCGGEWPTISFDKLNNHLPPDPRGYRLEGEGEGPVHFEVLEPAKRRGAREGADPVAKIKSALIATLRARGSCSKNALVAATQGRKSAKLEALEILISEGAIVVVPGERNALICSLP